TWQASPLRVRVSGRLAFRQDGPRTPASQPRLLGRGKRPGGTVWGPALGPGADDPGLRAPPQPDLPHRLRVYTWPVLVGHGVLDTAHDDLGVIPFHPPAVDLSAVTPATEILLGPLRKLFRALVKIDVQVGEHASQPFPILQMGGLDPARQYAQQFQRQ